MQGDWGRLANSGNIDAYSNGPALIVSHYDKSLGVYPESHKPGSAVRPAQNEMGSVVDIGAVVLNSSWYPLTEELKEMFPDLKIIRADELKDYLEGHKFH